MTDFLLDREALDDRRLELLAGDALARLGDPEALAEAEARLQDPDEKVRARELPVAVALYRRLRRDPLRLLRDAMADPRAEVRLAALELARPDLDERLLPTVAALLRDRAERVRVLARKFVRASACQDLERIQPVLNLVIDRDQDVQHRLGALQALMYPHHMVPVAEALLQALEFPRPPVRLWAGKALPFFEDRSTSAERIATRLQQPLPREVRLSLLWALARVAVPEVRETLLAAASSGDPDSLAPAVFGLGLLGDSRDLARVRELRGGLRSS